MNPLAPFLFLILIFTAGCSPNDWQAKFHAVRAEAAVKKAHDLKEQKVGFDQRTPYFVEACDHYYKALELDTGIFTLTRIEEASDACWKAGQKEKEEIFRLFEEEYTKAHPQEAEYGDAGVGMIDMGG